MAGILLVAPDCDQATRICHTYADEIDDYINSMTWSGETLEVEYLEGEEACPASVLRELRVMSPDAYFHLDHGSYTRLYGQLDGKIIPVITMENAFLLSGMVIDALACQSCRDLGAKAVKEGAKVYIGYTEVAWVADDKNFREAMIESFKRLLDGKTAGEAYASQLARMGGNSCPVSKTIGRLFGQRALGTLRRARDRIKDCGPNPILKELLEYNAGIFKLKGDPMARVYRA